MTKIKIWRRKIKKIFKSFGKSKVLHDISAKFERGKTNLIIGQSGSGKTVLLIIGDPAETDKVTSRLKDKYSNLVEINKTFDNLCEVSSLQGNKLNSTKVLLDLLKLKGSDLFYFGDGEADIELFPGMKYKSILFDLLKLDCCLVYIDTQF